MKILITGFEPLRQFWTINPSWEAVCRLPDEIAGVTVIKEQLPIVYDKAEQKLSQLVEAHKPDAVVCVGQSGQDNAITIERIGTNLDDFNVPDNAGNLRIDLPVVENAPDAYFTTLPARQMLKAITEVGIPAALSTTAGTHLCNHMTYYSCHLARTRYPHMLTGFIHIPLDISQCVQGRGLQLCRYFMDINTTVRGLEAALQALSEHLKAG